MHLRILLVGSNPSNQSDDNTAFHESTKSRKFLDKLFEGKHYSITYINVLDIKTENNKPLSTRDIKENLQSIRDRFADHKEYKVVSFGRFASKALSMIGVVHYSMPHPSGRCRVWNDGALSEKLRSEMFEWIENE